MNQRGMRQSPQVSDRGAVTAMVIVIIGVAMAAVGLVYDLGMAAVARSEAADAASTLARAGASQLDRDIDGEHVRSADATQRIELLAAERWPQFNWIVTVTVDEVTVTVTGRYDAVVMNAFGWHGTDLEVTHSATTRR